VDPYHSCTQAFGLEDQTRAIERQLAENDYALAETHNRLSELEFGRSVLECRHDLLHQVLEQTPDFEELFERQTIKIDELASNFEVAKNAADPISERITRLRDLATTMTRHPTLQKEYVAVLIDMSTLGCMDVRRARIIDQMLREVSSYPAVVEDESLGKRLEEASETCRRMSHVFLGESDSVSWFFHSRFAQGPGETSESVSVSDTLDPLRESTPDRSVGIQSPVWSSGSGSLYASEDQASCDRTQSF
jgi:hypothetical protein